MNRLQWRQGEKYSAYKLAWAEDITHTHCHPSVKAWFVECEKNHYCIAWEMYHDNKTQDCGWKIYKRTIGYSKLGTDRCVVEGYGENMHIAILNCEDEFFKYIKTKEYTDLTSVQV